MSIKIQKIFNQCICLNDSKKFVPLKSFWIVILFYNHVENFYLSLSSENLLSIKKSKP